MHSSSLWLLDHWSLSPLELSGRHQPIPSSLGLTLVRVTLEMAVTSAGFWAQAALTTEMPSEWSRLLRLTGQGLPAPQAKGTWTSAPRSVSVQGMISWYHHWGLGRGQPARPSTPGIHKDKLDQSPLLGGGSPWIFLAFAWGSHCTPTSFSVSLRRPQGGVDVLLTLNPHDFPFGVPCVPQCLRTRQAVPSLCVSSRRKCHSPAGSALSFVRRGNSEIGRSCSLSRNFLWPPHPSARAAALRVAALLCAPLPITLLPRRDGLPSWAGRRVQSRPGKKPHRGLSKHSSYRVTTEDVHGIIKVGTCPSLRGSGDTSPEKGTFEVSGKHPWASIALPDGKRRAF